jgi:hypothetical protein
MAEKMCSSKFGSDVVAGDLSAVGADEASGSKRLCRTRLSRDESVVAIVLVL